MAVDNSRKIYNIREKKGCTMSTQTITDKVLSRIYGKKRGWVFTPIHFRDLGDDLSIRKSLQILSDRGVINRLDRGVYFYPETHPKIGILYPTPEQIALALSGKANLRIQASGAYAANLLGLSEQVPAQAVFLTDGMDRKLNIGNWTIVFKRTTPKNMATARRVSGLVIQALRYLGQKHVDDSTVGILARRLPKKDRQDLMKDIQYAPAWIGDIFRRLAEWED
jgi:hypothetical protein